MLTVLDLFSGIGGFSLGLERAGMKTVAFCEIEPYAQQVLKKHWPDVPIYADVREVTLERLHSDGINRIDVVTGGFPCQDLSCAGRQAGFEGERSGLYWEIRRIIGEVRPRYAIMENVTNLLNGNGGNWFGDVLRGLAEVGYDAEWHCISAAHVGAPHRRDRIWIIAYPCEIRCNTGGAEQPLQRFGEFGEAPMGWAAEPGMGRVAHGVSNHAHRIAALGNSVVPQIPEMIGRAILATMNE